MSLLDIMEKITDNEWQITDDDILNLDAEIGIYFQVIGKNHGELNQILEKSGLKNYLASPDKPTKSNVINLEAHKLRRLLKKPDA